MPTASHASEVERLIVRLLLRGAEHVLQRILQPQASHMRRQGGHPHIVRALGAGTKPDGTTVIVTELGCTSMLDFLQHCRPRPKVMGKSFFREWVMQLVHSLSYAHNHGIAHRDVQPAHVFLFGPARAGSKANASDGGAGVLPTADELLVTQRRLLNGAAQAAYTHVNRSLHKAGLVAKLGEWGKAFCNSHEGEPCLGQPSPAARCRFPTGSETYASPQIVFLAQAQPSTQSKLLVSHAMAEALPPLSPEGRAATAAAPGATASAADSVHILRTQGYSPFAGDVWSLGVTLFVLRAGNLPWDTAAVSCPLFRGYLTATQPHVLRDELCLPGSKLWVATTAEADEVWTWPIEFPPALVHLLSGCLKLREGERMSIGQVMHHPWFKDPQWVPPAQHWGQPANVSVAGGTRKEAVAKALLSSLPYGANDSPLLPRCAARA